MPSSYTSSLKLTLPSDGEINWGTLVNNGVTTLIDASIAGVASIALVGATDRTLSDYDGIDDEARKMFVNVTGTPGAPTNIICPAVPKLYFVSNATSPGFAITLKTSAGTGISVPAGAKMVLYCNGTNVLDAITQMSSLALTNALAATSGGTGLTAVGTAGNLLTSNGTVWTSAAPASSVAGSTTQVQYNNAGVLAGSANLTFNGTSLTVNGVTIGRGLGNASSNMAVGPNALESYSGGLGGSTAIGPQALQKQTSGYGNTAVGYAAGGLITSGANNVALGGFSLFYTTTGTYNVAVGGSALQNVTTGTDNIAVGTTAATGNVSGIGNIAMGSGSLNLLSTGTRNVSIGHFSGLQISGSYNVCVGAYTGNPAGCSGSNLIMIGDAAQCSSTSVSNEITLGNSSITTLRCNTTSITSLSDARDKTNIQPLIPGLNFINRLRPVSFDWNMRDGGKVGVADTGFIAQELQSNQNLTQEFVPGLVYTENPEKLEAAYGKLIPVLVKAIQELTARVAELEGK